MKNLFSLNLIFLLLITSTFLYSQNTESITQIEKLQTFAKQKAIQYEKQKAEAIEWAKLNGYPIRVDTDGRLMEIQYIDELGKPQYYITDNADAAATISTDQVYTGGSAGLNLDGSGITVREWDGGGVRLTHQEYGGRVVMGDGASPTHYHSTHVAGTIMASGVQSNAKGMAFNANLRAFDWGSDESEMATEAAAGALMSNHSYGYVRGWWWNSSTSSWEWNGNASISTVEDYLFGFYDSYSQDWDIIAHNAPYYLIVKSAGNDRGDGPGTSPPNDGPYDCIGQHGIAKNVLTVGAVYDILGGYTQPADVVMSSFSSWGPADDGRIKPDIVTNGISVYSTDHDNDSDYRTLQGTSMAAPSATGSLALLQQHWENLNGSGNYMLASTLKALAIHTADEAGLNDGPDYEYGWGLMNTETAALKISEDQILNVIDEISLSNGDSYTHSVYSNGTEPLKATICWTDVPGTPVAAVLDPINPMLVNDLDLKITIGTSTYYPWKLDRDNPSNAATDISENDVDNVEVVYIFSPAAGDYTVTVDHDGTLSGGSQTFSIILSGISLINVPVADFSGTPLSGNAPLSVSFTDASTGTITSYAWTFGDGGTSTDQNPSYDYSTPGTYDVSLTVTGPGGSDTETKTDYITVTDDVVAEFVGTPLSGGVPLSVDFSDLSTGTITGYSWTFGDGGTSTQQNPVYVYNTPGTYDVSLTVTGPGGSDTETKTDYITVTDDVVAEFVGTPLSGGVPLSVDFSDLSTGTITGYSWTFGDGGTSTDQNPTHVYNAFGTYTVSLTVTGPGGSDTETKTDYITVTDDVVAEFVGTPLSGGVPLSVDFSDLSTGTITGYSWTFGDGGTSTDQNPTHVYNAFGTYTVSLTVTGPGGSDTETKTDYITVTDDVVAEFVGTPLSGGVPLSVDFSDLSTGTITGYSWTFGDGGTSTDQNPTHVYNAFGTYTVSLTVTGPGGSDTETKTDYITVTDDVVAEFVGTPLSGGVPLSVDFSDLSTGTITGYSWTFGDGGTSTQQNPVYVYNTPGTYDVSLTVTGPGGSDTETKTDYITVTDDVVAEFVGTPLSGGVPLSVDFSDLSTGTITGYSWTFGDGGTSTDQNPTHVYNAFGTYTVSLTVTGPGGSDTETKTDYITVTDDVVAEFVGTPLSGGVPLSVDFSDLSTGTITGYSWTFGDGGTSTQQNPVYVYNTPGTYDVSLTVTGPGGSDTETKTSYITVIAAAPVADFSADNLTPNTDETVNFTDLSTNIPTSWAWVFTPSTITYMDGTDASTQNPKVRFDNPGAYTVELTATNAGGSDTEIKTDYINATVVPPVADFVADNTTPDVGETVTFTDLSSNTPTSWLWSFTPSTITYVSGTDQNSQHPQVQFNASGLYTVELTATNAGGSDTETKPGYINAGDVFEVIATATPDEICFGESSQLHAFPSGGSGNYTFIWTSDPPGYYSNLQNPTVEPEVTTTYTVEVDDGSLSVFDDVTVIVNPLPVITLGDWPELLCNKEEPPVQLTADPPGGIYSGAAVTMNGLFDPEIAPLGWNVITYTYEDGNGCENTAQDSIYVDDCVGIYNMFIEKAHVNLYPNPNTGEFTVTSNFTITRIDINNQMGKLLLSEESESDKVHFNMILPRGLYFVRTFISDKNNKIGLVNKKLVIQ